MKRLVIGLLCILGLTLLAPAAEAHVTLRVCDPATGCRTTTLVGGGSIECHYDVELRTTPPWTDLLSTRCTIS